MQKELTEILFMLKTKNISLKKIEEDLEFSNGVLGKAVKGIANLSPTRFEMVKKYFIENYAFATPTGVFIAEEEVVSIAKEIEQEQTELPQIENNPQEDEKINFEGVTIFRIEEYTKYPLSAKPKTATELISWNALKKKSDAKIKEQYDEHKANKQNSKP